MYIFSHSDNFRKKSCGFNFVIKLRLGRGGGLFGSSNPVILMYYIPYVYFIFNYYSDICIKYSCVFKTLDKLGVKKKTETPSIVEFFSGQSKSIFFILFPKKEYNSPIGI